MDASELQGKSVGELRKMVRAKYAQCRGAFATEATRNVCEAILLGTVKPEEAIEIWMDKKSGRTGASSDDLAEGVGGDNPPAGDGELGHEATERAVLAGVDALQFMKRAVEADAIIALQAQARERLDELHKLREQAKRLSAKDQTTDMKVTDGKVKIAGVEVAIVEPDEVPGGIEAGGGATGKKPNPKLAHVPDVDDNYRFDIWRARRQCGAMAFTQKAGALVQLLLAGKRVLVVGPPAVGKTSVVEQFAARAKWPVTRFPCKRDVTLDDFVGTKEAGNGSTYFVHGPLPVAMKEGHILILDELDHMPAECSSVLHSVLEPGGKLMIAANSGEVIKPHPNFRIIATANTAGFGDETGLHAAAKVQDSALLSRFPVVFRVGYHDPKDESDLLVRCTGIGPDDAEKIVKIATDVRQACAQDEVSRPLSLRHTLAWADLLASGMSMPDAMALSVLNTIPDADVAAVAEIAQRHLGDVLEKSLTA